MSEQDEARLDDLKRLLRRLQRLETERVESAKDGTNAHASAAEEPRRDGTLATMDGLAQLGARGPGLGGQETPVALPAPRPVPLVPVIVEASSSGADAPRQRGMMTVVLAAAATAAVVSSVAAVILTLLLTGRSERPTQAARPSLERPGVAGAGAAQDAPHTRAAGTAQSDAQVSPGASADDPQDGASAQPGPQVPSDLAAAPGGPERDAPPALPVNETNAPLVATAEATAEPTTVAATTGETPASPSASAATSTADTPPVGADPAEPVALPDAPSAGPSVQVAVLPMVAQMPAVPEAPAAAQALAAPEAIAVLPTASEPAPTPPAADADSVATAPAVAPFVVPSRLHVAAGKPVRPDIRVAADVGGPAPRMIIISGLTRGSVVTSGVELLTGTWQVPVSQLDRLAIDVPTRFARHLPLALDLRAETGETIARAEIMLDLDGAARDVIGPESLAVAASEPEAARRLLAQGERLVDNGNIKGARLQFEKAASAGSAIAALLIAASRDPRSSATFGLSDDDAGAGPDLAEARRWYQRARDMGLAEAARRMEALPVP
ncbi:MAG: hypothetical protein NW217_00825 [Hyphomicrobiaceae bacterium]|nr:hypothetical protein [Hyphomicrobiaceae bacterium]